MHRTPHLTGSVAAMLLTLAGCDVSSSDIDLIEGLTNPLVLQGLILSVDAPPPVDLAAAGLVEGPTAGVFLADAADAPDLSQAPVREAEVRLHGRSIGTVFASEVAPGAYVATPVDGLSYSTGASLQVDVVIGLSASQAAIVLPDAPAATLPAVHPAASDLVIDLRGQGFDAAVVAVFGPSGLTYSNVPNGIEELYHVVRSGISPVVTIPGAALSESGAHAFGIAGLVTAATDNFVNMNTALSDLSAGQMVFAFLTVQ